MAIHMKIPSDYRPGYAKARAHLPELADRYIAHTDIGDPVADTLMEDIMNYGVRKSESIIQAAMNENQDNGLDRAPASFKAFFEDAEAHPVWLDFSEFRPGVHMFHRNSQLVLAAFVAGVLVEGFATNISKSFFITGRLRDQGFRRLGQNNRHLIEIFVPDGLQRFGDGWKLSVRTRLVHARVRYLLRRSVEWDTEAWGLPLSAAHLGLAVANFSARLLHHMKRLGADYTDEEYESFMAVWRYSGYLMGIPETILYRDPEEALGIYEIGSICEPGVQDESIVMAHALINTAPLFAGRREPRQRRALANYIFRISHSLIGDELARSLLYPSGSTFGVLGWFRWQRQYGHILDKLFPGHRGKTDFNHFTSLLDVSHFDEDGIRYALPRHVYAEESGDW